jgi:hypothetical protein
MKNVKVNFTRCPLCKCVGQQLDGNSLVWYHATTDNRGNPETHRWSVKTGRMLVWESEENSVW